MPRPNSLLSCLLCCLFLFLLSYSQNWMGEELPLEAHTADFQGCIKTYHQMYYINESNIMDWLTNAGRQPGRYISSPKTFGCLHERVVCGAHGASWRRARNLGMTGNTATDIRPTHTQHYTMIRKNLYVPRRPGS